MAMSKPSRSHHLTREGWTAFVWSCEISASHLGPNRWRESVPDELQSSREARQNPCELPELNDEV
jgi:hypothetical protein